MVVNASEPIDVDRRSAAAFVDRPFQSVVVSCNGARRISSSCDRTPVSPA